MNLDRARADKLNEKFNVEGIPHLVVLSSSLEIITTNGVDEVGAAPEEALRKWSQGKHLFWTREPKEDEYVWEDEHCIVCYMSPIVGSRHTCIDVECKINLCETCLLKKQHEHPLVECFIPKRRYPLEKLLATIPYLLDPKKEEKTESKTILDKNTKSIGFYFSAHWCPPCRAFTPKLVDIYNKAQPNSDGFHMIFISSDEDEDSFNRYRSEMPWPAASFKSGSFINEYFQLSGQNSF